eukprot:GCRY01001917.1.p1 GENE.GCRY01001917.1~~GCRY01001917.1.p1  ORF type:complete len:495 (+),score=112.81 GCRY01001917.1:123-1607(+)
MRHSDFLLRLSTLLFFVLLVVPPSLQWGLAGHSVVAKLAQEQLMPSALEKVNLMLNEIDTWKHEWKVPFYDYYDKFLNRPVLALQDFCVAPDQFVHYNSSMYEDYQVEHFVNANDRDGAALNFAVDCPPPSIWNATDQLLWYEGSPALRVPQSCSCRAASTLFTDLSRLGHEWKWSQWSADFRRNVSTQLLFLVHYVGDIHQPFHASYAYDSGGNGARVRWDDTCSNMHKLWDSDILEKAGASAQYWASFASLLLANSRAFYDENLKPHADAAAAAELPYEWCQDSFAIVKNWAYNVTLNASYTGPAASCDHALTPSEEYVKRSIDTARTQLTFAGARLALLLNMALSDQDSSSPRDTPAPLLAALAAGVLVAVCVGAVLGRRLVRTRKRRAYGSLKEASQGMSSHDSIASIPTHTHAHPTSTPPPLGASIETENKLPLSDEPQPTHIRAPGAGTVSNSSAIWKLSVASVSTMSASWATDMGANLLGGGPPASS